MQVAERYISTTEAARLTNRCQRTITRWIETGRVKAIKPGGVRQWLVDLDTLPRKEDEDDAE